MELYIVYKKVPFFYQTIVLKIDMYKYIIQV